MKKIYLFSTLTDGEKAIMSRNRRNNFYAVKFADGDAERIYAGSLGLPLDACAVLSNRRVLCLRYFDGNREANRAWRLLPLLGQFTKKERKTIAGNGDTALGTISSDIFVARNYNFSHVDSSMAGMCLNCGRVFATEAQAREHKCSESYCRNCGAVIRSREELNAHLCVSCARERVERVYSYHGRPNRSTPRFEKPNGRGGDVHLGAEVEICGGSEFYSCTETARKLSRAINGDDVFAPMAQFENDSSINDGVECIFAPYTFNGLEKRKDRIANLYQTATSAGGRFNRYTGVHFHIDRAFFGEDTERAAMSAVFIELMVYKYFDFFASICRRPCGYFNYACKKEGVTGIASAFLQAGHHSHSYAVNGSNDHTIELRIFGGAINNADDFLAAADIAQAVARWAKRATFGSAGNATPLSLIPYIKNAANVAQFCKNAREDRPRTTAGEEMRAAFVAALEEKASKEGE